MNYLRVILLFTCGFVGYVLAAPQSAQMAMQGALNAANSNKRPGQLQLSLNGAGTGSNANNWNAAGNAGIYTKLHESTSGNHAFGAGVSAGQSFGSSQGHFYKSRPDVGFGVGYRFRF